MKPTDKTHCVIAPFIGKFWVNEKQADEVTKAMSSGDKVIKIGDSVIRAKSITAVVTGEHIETMDRERRGEWLCKHGYWHQKNEQCGHHLV